MCAALVLSEPRPMLPPRMAGTLTSGPVADPLSCDVFANVHLCLDYEADLEKAVDPGDSRFSGL
jgi:hypothetical protein